MDSVKNKMNGLNSLMNPDEINRVLEEQKTILINKARDSLIENMMNNGLPRALCVILASVYFEKGDVLA